MPVTIEEIADAMFKLIEGDAGKKKYKQNDLFKAMKAQFGKDAVDKKMAKDAVKLLINSSRCVYTYFGGSFIEIPHKEGAAPDE